MSQEKFATKGRTIRNPGRGGENSPKKFVQRKIPGKKFAQPLRERKKIVQANSKVQIVLKKNSCKGIKYHGRGSWVYGWSSH
jgi:hypothetical protein